MELKKKVSSWWDKNKTTVKVGVACLGIGLIFGYVRGIKLGSLHSANTINRLINDLNNAENVTIHDIVTCINDYGFCQVTDALGGNVPIVLCEDIKK